MTNITADTTFDLECFSPREIRSLLPKHGIDSAQLRTTLHYILDLYFSLINQLRGGIPQRQLGSENMFCKSDALSISRIKGTH